MQEALEGMRHTWRHCASGDPTYDAVSALVTAWSETTLGYLPTGDGSVCYRAATGVAFDQVQNEVVELLRATGDTPDVRVTTDEFGYTWIEIDREPGSDVEGLCTALHAVNTGLESQGFGPGLLCTVIGFADPSGLWVDVVEQIEPAAGYWDRYMTGGGA